MAVPSVTYVNPSSPAMKAIINDQLRQDSMKRAFRNAEELFSLEC